MALLHTEWQRKTRNRILRVARNASNTVLATCRRVSKAGDVELVAALAKQLGDELVKAGNELLECARDLGHE